jgi:hypothetical protein
VPKPKALMALSKPGPLPYAEAYALIQQLLPAKEIAAADQAAIRQAFADHPNLWRTCGDLAVQARFWLIETATHQPVVQEGIRAGVRALSRDLGRDQAPPLEQLLIDQVLLCWINQYTV